MEVMRWLTSGILFVGCLSLFFLLPAYLFHRKFGHQPPALLAVSGYIVSVLVWALCLSFVKLI